MEYGLIGATLKHSYSKLIHEQLYPCDYKLTELPTEAEAREFLEKQPFKAINVTIPYKQLVIPYCAVLDEKARAIGAVNTVVNVTGVLHGYNTDFDGFAFLAAAHGVEFSGRRVLILGTGGTSRTVTAVAKAAGAAQVLYASRTPGEGRISYEEALSCGAQVVVNTSPAGMYPNNDALALDVAKMPGLEAVLDAVYTPFSTRLVQAGRAAGAKRWTPRPSSPAPNPRRSASPRWPRPSLPKRPTSALWACPAAARPPSANSWPGPSAKNSWTWTPKL